MIQEARSRVSCVVERRRADQVMDGANNNNVENNTDSRYQRLSGERVAILCESGNPHQEYVHYTKLLKSKRKKKLKIQIKLYV